MRVHLCMRARILEVNGASSGRETVSRKEDAPVKADVLDELPHAVHELDRQGILGLRSVQLEIREPFELGRACELGDGRRRCCLREAAQVGERGRAQGAQA